MPIKLGTIPKTLPFAKAYLGTVLKYQKASPEIAFTTCPFPTSWTLVKKYTQYKATNNFGEWAITSATYYSSSYNTSKAFDGNTSTYWRVNDVEDTLQIDCPILINPSHVYIKVDGAKYTKTLEGYNTEIEAWEEIGSYTGSATIDVDISTNGYYSKFRITADYTNITFKIYEFQITSGFIKEA